MYTINCVLLGDNKTGKSSFIKTLYTEKDSTDNLSETIGIDFINKTILLNNNEYRIKFWDLSGSHRFIPIMNTYLKTASIILIFYSYNSITSVKNINVWLNLLNDFNIKKDLVFLIGSWFDINKNIKDQNVVDINKEIESYSYKSYKIDSRNYSIVSNVFLDILNNSDLSNFYKPIQSRPVQPESTILEGDPNQDWWYTYFPCFRNR